jgi:mRNA interferase HigB
LRDTLLASAHIPQVKHSSHFAKSCCIIFAGCEDIKKKQVRIISRKKLKQAAGAHAEVSASLDAWYRIARKAAWKNLADVRITWSSADIFGECTIFNIKGNKYRLIAWINYRTKKMFIRHVLTHAEYTKGGWKYDCSGR